MIPFAELLAKTNYSFLVGASFPEEMVTEAAAQKYVALGICDLNGVYGLPRAHQAAQGLSFPLIMGAEFFLEGHHRISCLAKTHYGYGNLCELLTEAHRNRAHGDRTPESVIVPWASFAERSKDLFCLVDAGIASEKTLSNLKALFGKDLFLVATHFHDSVASLSFEKAKNFSRQLQLKCIASNLPLFHVRERKPLQDVLTCIRLTCPLKEGGFRLLQNSERHLKSLALLKDLFRQHPEWLTQTVEIAGECNFSLDEITYQYPTEWIPSGETGDSYLRRLVWEGAVARYGREIPQRVREQIERELALIQEANYCNYFLTVWDIVCFARSQGILCQGRGSAANSTVCYVLGITSIDPVRMDLLFERFISRERKEPPDIDVDFEHERREEVIQYIYKRYGRHRAAITAEVICFRKRSALREVGKVFGISLAQVEKCLMLTHRKSLGETALQDLSAAVPDISSSKLSLFLKTVTDILGFPRHLGTHVGGFVLCQDSLSRHVPIENAAMEERSIIQWDKNDLDALGFVRVDILGLGILTVIRKSFEYIKEKHGQEWTLATLPPEDSKVYDAICEADTVGVFQIESRAQMSMLPRLKPRNFFDLVVEISLVRPGPIQGDMVHPYLRRRAGLEPIEYAHPDLKGILEKTCGVPLFQEQIMKMGMQVAGFTAGEADELRRAMGAWRRNGYKELHAIGYKFKEGLVRRGISPAMADRIFHQIEGFAEYGFPESHAASFAVLAYATAWLKVYHPGIFLCALLNSQPMGFYANHVLIHDAQKHGVNLEGIDIQCSFGDNRMSTPRTVRLGFREIRGFPERTARAIERARSSRFLSLPDFVARVQKELAPHPLTKRELFCLASAHAFESLGFSRREALWEIQGLSLTDSPFFSPEDGKFTPPEEEMWERLILDYHSQGVSLLRHPMALLRESLDPSLATSETLGKIPSRTHIRVAGMVVCRQIPDTKSGVLFVTMEDEWGFINLVIWRPVREQFREPLFTHSFLCIEGRLEKTEGGKIVHIIAQSVEALLAPHVSPRISSHDFH